MLRDTPYKFYLTATVQERARRRLLEMQARGTDGGRTLEQVAQEIAQRDYNDSHRAFMPLRRAEDAHLIDTTGMTADEVTDEVLRCVRALRERAPGEGG